MRISVLIAVLQDTMAEHGDLEVGIDNGVTDYWQCLEPNPQLIAFTRSVVIPEDGTPEGAPRSKVLSLRWDEDDARLIDYEHPDSNDGVDPEEEAFVELQTKELLEKIPDLNGLTEFLIANGFPDAEAMASEDYSLEDDEIDLGGGAYLQVAWEARGPVFVPHFVLNPDSDDPTFWSDESKPFFDVLEAARAALALKQQYGQ